MDHEQDIDPAFSRNDAPNTMGWPISDIPGADSLDYASQDAGMWQFVEPADGVKVTLKSFRFSIPAVDGNLDLVGPHGTGPSGKPDFVGQFVIEVEPCAARPSNLLLWLQTVAGMTAGGLHPSQQHVSGQYGLL